jgi:hypothetical protein
MGLIGLRSMTASADPVSGQYSMEVAVAETSVAVNGQFAAYAGIYHSGGSYQAAQWHIDYPETVVDVVSVANGPGAPSECVASSDDGTRVLLGCVRIDTASQMTFAGNAWIISFKCIANGTANITVAIGAGVASPTGVLNTQGTELPLHTHSDIVTCGAGGTPPPPPPPPPTGDQCTVSEVLTGDSFKCTDGKTVRMLQIDAQDLNQCGGGWAKSALQYIFLTPGRVVTLDYDATKSGPGGVTLAAPIARGTDGFDYNMSIVMVYVGLAKAANLGDGNVKFLDWANASQTWATAAKWNMWAPGKTYTGGCD